MYGTASQTALSGGNIMASLVGALILTLFVYGIFPLVFAGMREKCIKKGRYKLICFAVNFVVMVAFIALGSSSSGAPYLIWTWVFTSIGVRMLEKKGALADAQSDAAAKRTAAQAADAKESEESGAACEECACFGDGDETCEREE